jgi:PAS domain S-box-containing protein
VEPKTRSGESAQALAASNAQGLLDSPGKTTAIEDPERIDDRFFALSIDMLCIAHFSGYFKRLNPAWEKTLGYSREELQSKKMFEFVHPEDRERTLDQNRRVRGGGQALAFENRYRCKDGSYKWLLWSATADLEHQVIYSVARDITERKQAEHERERLVRELQAAFAEVKELQKTLPICMYIRDDENYWQTVEAYVSQHTNTTFSHGICPACYKNVVEPQLGDSKKPVNAAGRSEGRER